MFNLTECWKLVYIGSAELADRPWLAVLVLVAYVWVGWRMYKKQRGV